MFRLIYRLIVQRIQEYKTKRTATKKQQIKRHSRKSSVNRKYWVFVGVFCIICATAIAFSLHRHFNLPRLYLDPKTAQLKINVDSVDTPPLVIYLEQWPPPLTPVPENDSVSRIVIQDSKFVPKFQLITAGSTVEIINEDSILHNTHIDDGKNTVFNVATPLKSVTVRKTLTSTGILNVRCDLHPGMYSWVFVPPAPQYSVLQEPDLIHWTNIPPATYRLISWQPEQTPQHRIITLSSGKQYTLQHHQRNQ